ncbi:hypothetical protein M413DRAFT_30277 [Hebeloma cylindrosporum]|uniref:Uncharacterized protein n=1 Tax=Hebeloma cylindrosporum TaxID=76867 RepID=A0A0C2XK67_HEBCY|nr:hypothetical protein M413DRAFT_30277 [Hebeloma cylindrosporum h7]
MQLEGMIQELQEKRRILRSRMNATHDPFNFKLPPEIASLIFSLSLQKEDYEPDKYTLSRLPTAFLLASMCRRWRQLARSTPELWSTMSFTLVKPNTNTLPPLQFISDWLRLSGSLPLTLWIIEEACYNLHWETCPSVVDAINQHSGRWHKVVLHLHKQHFIHFRGIASPSNLYDLEIILDEGYHETPFFSMISRPSPVHLTIDSCLSASIDIAWSHLTCITLRWLPAEECVRALKLGPLLESCTLSCLIGDYDSWPPQPRLIFRHVHLRKLFISEAEGHLLPGFIDLVEFPSIEELSCAPSYGLMKKSLIPFLQRSGNRLKRLKVLIDILDVPNTSSALIELLHTVPYLQNLECQVLMMSAKLSNMIASDLFRALSWAPPILPKLQCLVIRSGDIGDIWEYIPRLFSRHLVSLKFETRGRVDIRDDELDKILKLVDEGCDIHIFEDGQDYLQKARAQQHSLANSPST